MEKTRHLFIYCMLLLIPCAIFADELQNMMNQYKIMGAGTSKNFPKELETLVPKGFSIEVKNIVYKETANLFLFVGLGGKRKNDMYVKFGHETEFEIGIMAYNPQTASYMASQMPVILQESRKGYGQNQESNSADYQYGPVVASKINQADVYMQKVTRLNVEVDDRKHEDQVYYNAQAILMNKNAMLKIRILYYPMKSENVKAAITEITKVFLGIQLDKYMR